MCRGKGDQAMATSIDGRSDESFQIGLWVGGAFDRPRREALNTRVEPPVVGCDWPDPAEAVSVVVLFTDDPEAVIGGETPTVVATSEPSVAAAAAEADRPTRVVRWNRNAPPWSFLEATLSSFADDEAEFVGEIDRTRTTEPAPTTPDELELAKESATVTDGPEPTIATYDQLMETVGDAVYALDTDGRFTYVNEAMTELTGYEPEEIVGEPPGVIKDEQTVYEAERALAGMLSSEGPDDASVELDVIRKDGMRVPCEDHMTLLIEDGEFTGTVGTLRDLTKQKRREEMFEGLLAATQEMMEAEDPRLIAGIAARTVEETLHQDLTTVRLREDDELVPVASNTETRDTMPPRPSYGVDEGPVGEAYETGETVRLSAEDAEDGRDRGEMAVGLYLPMGDHGTITIGSRVGDFDEQDRRFAELLATTTERALSRAEREQSLRRYEKLVETIDELAFVADENREFTMVTPSFAAVLGRDRETLIGESITTVGDGVFERVYDRLADDESADSVTAEGGLVTPDGRLPIRARGSAVSTDTLDGFVVAVDDISDLLSARREASRSRDRFGGLFDALTDPVVELEAGESESIGENESIGDTDGVSILRTNDSFETLVRNATGECAPFDGVELPEPVCERLRGAVGRAQGGATTRVEGERTELSLTVNGQTRYFVARDVPYDVDDHPHSFVVFTEVTDLRRREQHTAVLTRILRHNLRNELTVLQGYAGEVERAATDERVATAADRIREAGGKLESLSDMAGVVQHVLRADETEPVEQDPALVVDDVVTTVEERHPKGTVETAVEADGSIVATRQLSRALTELADNGLAHNPDRDPSVEIGIRKQNGHVEITVADDGPAIPHDEWEVVTERREITQLQHGSGLGLWLVRWVVEDNGGELYLRDNDDEGTTIVIRLPDRGV